MDRPDALDELPASRPPARQQPEDLAEPACIEGPPLGCFLWATPIPAAGWGEVVVGDEVVVTMAPGGGLTARHLRDGTPAWDIPQEAEAVSGALATAGDLLIHRTRGALVGRSLTSGAELWSNPDLLRLEVRQGHRAGDTVVVAGSLSGVSDSDGLGRGWLAAGLEAATGELLWHVDGREVTIAADGLAVVLTADDLIQAYEPSGDRRWEVEGPDGPGGFLWATGHVLRAVTEGETEELPRHVADGRPLGDVGWPVGTDGEVTLVTGITWAEDGEPRLEHLTLLDDDGVRWRVDDVPEAAARDGCYHDAAFTADVVVLIGCLGSSYTLDRADGSTVAWSERPAWLADLPPDDLGFQRLGRYAIFRGGGEDEVVLHDADGTRIATLPRDTWPVEARDTGWYGHHAGVVVLHSHGWLTALPLDGPPPPGDRPGGP